ncbi:MAG: glycoside hydrolase family 2 TIM barrel-domain containing protein [Phycisphaerae bacterium]|jgi:hypothetical protein
MKKLLTAIILLCSSFVVAGTEQWTSLNGTWQSVAGKGLAELPADGWHDFQLPGKSDSYGVGGASYMWVKRQIDIPQEWQNRRVFVRFNSCRYNPHVYVDGRLMGQRMDGWNPLEVEITSAVKPGSTHWLQLRCQDKSAVFPDGFILEPNQPESVLSGKILAPVGGYSFFYGPMDDAWLFSRPNIYIDDIVIVPSTRKGVLTVSGVISDPCTNLWIEGRVLDKNEPALEIPASPVAGGAKWEISAPFPNAKYWSPESPHLYKLQLVLRNGKDGPVLDTLEERFGFKEFWIEGPDFYLNGVKRHLLASSTWPTSQVQSYDYVRKALETIKAGNNIAFRYHVSPWPKRWVEIADEVGVMIICEAAVYTDSIGMYAYNDEKFWANYREHLEGLVKRDRNNASVIMWSIENEILFMGTERYCPDLAKRLGSMGRFVKQLDPYHPITFEADLDPDGAADVIGLHYPHELPTYTDWPNTAEWLAQRTRTEAGGGMLGVTRRNFYWDRTKPLYIGEYLWVPQEDYSSGTIFFGDDAYIDKDIYHYKAKLCAWIDQTLAYRRMGVSGICPWTCFNHGVVVNDVFYEAQKDFFRPVAVFLRNKDTRFFAGDTVERTLDVFNDSVTDCNFEMIWYISDTNIKDEQVSRRIKALECFSLKAGEYKPVNIRFAAPDVNSPTEYELKVTLSANGKLVDSISPKFVISKRQPVVQPANTKILLYDPCNTFSKNIPSAQRISLFSGLNDADAKKDIVVIAPQMTAAAADGNNIQQIGSAGVNFRDLIAFLAGGGRAIMLEQNSLDSLGLNISLVKKSSTMTFCLNKEHPILKGLSADDLKFWRGDNYVTAYEISRPAGYGAGAVIVSGGDQYIEHSGILELPVGKGSILFIQSLVGAKFNTEPAAGKIFRNSLEYMAAKKINETKTVVFGDDVKFTKAIVAIGLKQNKIDDLNDNDLKTADVLVLQGGGEKIIKSKDTIGAFLDNGKTVYWHCPDAETFAALKDVIGAGSLKITDSQGPVAVELRQHKLLSGISREDLLFMGGQRGWRRAMSIDPGVIDRAIIPQQADSNQQRIEAEKLELTGNTVSVNSAGDTVMFESRGTATGWITVPQSGMYILSLVAGGREFHGSYPFVIIKVGDETVGQINLTQSQMREYSFLAKLPAGKNKLVISFLNGPHWGVERALQLDALIVGQKADIPKNVELLTLPAALTSIFAGKGTVIIDNVRWENDANNIRGLRYASALFANIGVQFEVPRTDEVTRLILDSFNLVGDSPYFEKTNTQISLRNNGTISAVFNCAGQAEYALILKGFSTPAAGQYAVVDVKIDDKSIGQKEIANATSCEFEVGTVKIPAGKHTVSVSFINDALIDGRDRNLYIDEVGFKEITQKQAGQQ